MSRCCEFRVFSFPSLYLAIFFLLVFLFFLCFCFLAIIMVYFHTQKTIWITFSKIITINLNKNRRNVVGSRYLLFRSQNNKAFLSWRSIVVKIHRTNALFWSCFVQPINYLGASNWPLCFHLFPSLSWSQPQLRSWLHYTFYHQPASIKKENQTGWDSQGQACAPVSAAALWTGGPKVQVSADLDIAQEQVCRSWVKREWESPSYWRHHTTVASDSLWGSVGWSMTKVVWNEGTLDSLWDPSQASLYLQV